MCKSKLFAPWEELLRQSSIADQFAEKHLWTGCTGLYRLAGTSMSTSSLVEIQRELNEQGILVNERNVGKLYRQFLALLGATSDQVTEKLEETIAEHGGLIFGLDGLQPEGHGHNIVCTLRSLEWHAGNRGANEQATTEKLSAWLQAYQHYPALANVSDGEEAIISALKKTWPEVPHQRCQEHFLGNVAGTGVET